MHHVLQPLLVPFAAALTTVGEVSISLRSQYISTVGRQEWVANTTVVQWPSAETAIVVVDMWDVHWCHTATTRVAEIATPMNQTLEAARELGVHVIFAPSDVTQFYKDEPARMRTLALPKASKPNNSNVPQPTFPLGTSTDGGCDGTAPQGSPWTRQIATLTIDHDKDYLIAADLPSDPNAGEQELYNIVSKLGLKHLIYMGVHENMCIMGRPFAIERVRSWGWPRGDIAVMRELVDVMYTPKDPPYVTHDEGLTLHTAYVEKFWANSVSMYDFLMPTYSSTSMTQRSPSEL